MHLKKIVASVFSFTYLLQLTELGTKIKEPRCSISPCSPEEHFWKEIKLIEFRRCFLLLQKGGYYIYIYFFFFFLDKSKYPF